MCEIENRQSLCSSDFRSVYSQGCVQGFGLWPLRTSHPEMILEQSMVNKLKMLSVVCFYKQKHHTNLKCTPTSNVVFKYGLQTPLSVTILRLKEKWVLAIHCVSSCAKLS